MADSTDSDESQQPDVRAQIAALANDWLKWDKNKSTKNCVLKIVESPESDERTLFLSKMMLERLKFGTAGLRARMGAGFANMNDLVVIQTTQGLAAYIESLDIIDAHERGVVVGYDGRHHSWRFAALACWTLVKRGFHVYRFGGVCPTPFIPFTVTKKGCIAGIMITASHNPKEDNGYKVYWENGAQIIPPIDHLIEKHIMENLEPSEDAWDIISLDRNRLMEDPMDEISFLYCKAIVDDVFDLGANMRSKAVITYTAMHGVGFRFMEKAFLKAGLKQLIAVEEQKDPHPDFPTVVFPNPEENRALDLAIQTANKSGSNLILANDPDADRLAVAEKNRQGEWTVFTGNQLGALLGWWMLYRYKMRQTGDIKHNVYMLGSTVSTKFLKSMSKQERCYTYVETLTGFKWMGNLASQLQNDGKEVIFAFEEAIGFMCGTAVLDKDGISAGVKVAELAAYLYKKKKTLWEMLQDLYVLYGQHITKNGYFTCNDPGKIKSLFYRLRNWGEVGCYPQSLNEGQYLIEDIRDLTVGYDSSEPDQVAKLPTSSSEMITFTFENGLVATLRASGTEPKVKFYTELCSKPGHVDVGALNDLQDQMIDAIITEFLEPDVNDLVPMVE